jgi:hypothetical protein
LQLEQDEIEHTPREVLLNVNKAINAPGEAHKNALLHQKEVYKNTPIAQRKATSSALYAAIKADPVRYAQRNLKKRQQYVLKQEIDRLSMIEY